MIEKARTGTEADQTEALGKLWQIHSTLWIVSLARSIARKWGLGSADAADLLFMAYEPFSEAVTGPYDAAKAPGLEPGLQRYASKRVSWHLHRSAQKLKFVRLSETTRRFYSRILKVCRRMEYELSCTPLAEIIADELNIGVQFVEEALGHWRRVELPEDEFRSTDDGQESTPTAGSGDFNAVAGDDPDSDPDLDNREEYWKAIHLCLRDPLRSNKWIILLVLRQSPGEGSGQERPWELIAMDLADPNASIGHPAGDRYPHWPELYDEWALDRVRRFRPGYPIPETWPGVNRLFTNPSHAVPALTTLMLRRWYSDRRREFVSCYPERDIGVAPAVG